MGFLVMRDWGWIDFQVRSALPLREEVSRRNGICTSFEGWMTTSAPLRDFVRAMATLVGQTSDEARLLAAAWRVTLKPFEKTHRWGQEATHSERPWGIDRQARSRHSGRTQSRRQKDAAVQILATAEYQPSQKPLRRRLPRYGGCPGR